MKRALITGVTAQDGAFLAELLLGKGYEFHRIKRRMSLFNKARIDHLYEDPHDPDFRFILHRCDMTDSFSMIRIMQKVHPDEIYNLAAEFHVSASFEEPEYTANGDDLGVLRLLEAIRILGRGKRPASTRRPPRSYMAWCRRSRRKRRYLSIPARPMRWPSSMALRLR